MSKVCTSFGSEMATEAFCIRTLQCDLSFKTIGHIHDFYDSGENKVCGFNLSLYPQWAS